MKYGPHNVFWTGLKSVISETAKMARKDVFSRNLTLLITVVLSFVFFSLATAAMPTAFAQTPTTTSGLTSADGLGLLAAGLAIVGSCLAAGYAVGKAASSAAAAIVEKPSVFGPLLILAGLGEGIAIYGLLVAFEILSKIP